MEQKTNDVPNENNQDSLSNKERFKQAREQALKERAIKMAEKKEKQQRIKAEYLQLKKDYAVLKKQHKERILAKKQELKSQQLTRTQRFTMYREFIGKENSHYQELQQELLNKTSNDLRSSRFYLFKRWFFGIGKELKRVTWTPRKRVGKDFVIVLIIVLILVGFFAVLDVLLSALHIIGK